jgi:hypothetical protein
LRTYFFKNKEIHHILWNVKFHYRSQYSLPAVPLLVSYGIDCENVNCVQVFENVVQWQAFVEIGIDFLVACVQ